MTLVFVIYILAMFCVFRSYFKTGVMMVRIVGHFLLDRPSTFMISLLVSLVALVAVGVLLLSAAGLLQMIAFDTMSNTFGEVYLLIQIMEYIFLLYFVYYSTTFLISCTVSNYYLGNTSYSLC